MKLVEKILKEAVVAKQMLGSGSFKYVYPLRNNNYVVKKFSTSYWQVNQVAEECKFAELYPDFCANIIKVDYERGIMIQERLDAEGFEKDYAEVFNSDSDGRDITSPFIKGKLSEENIRRAYENQNNSSFINKLFLFLNKIKPLQEKFRLDIHQYNFGYDNHGNIKLLDW